MVKNILKYSFLLVAVYNFCVFAQPTTFVRTNVSAKQVKVKQPFGLRISVYTKTWFTSAPNLDNIVIRNALTIRKDRAQSIYKTINDVRYTILYFDFFVFPIKPGELNVPEIILNYSTPKVGDYKGEDVTRKTKPFNVTVEKPPNGFSLSNWLIAKSFSVTDSWNKKLSGLKVGDVIERTITIKAVGTIGALIPESDGLVISGVRTYHKMPIVKSRIIDGVPAGQRVEKVTYLLEKPGELIIPEQKYSWWNPVTKKIYTKTLPENKFIIAENPDLAILKSIQDSLDAINNAGQTEQVEEKAFTIFGLLIWQFVIFLALALIAIVQLKNIITYFINKFKERKTAYLQSEKYYFKQFKKACKQNDLIVIQNKMLEWLYKLSEENGLFLMKEFIAQYGNNELLNTYNLFEEKLFREYKTGQEFSTSKIFNLIKDARKNYLNREHRSVYINPLRLNL